MEQSGASMTFSLISFLPFFTLRSLPYALCDFFTGSPYQLASERWADCEVQSASCFPIKLAAKNKSPIGMKPVGPEYCQSRVASLSSVSRNKLVDSAVGHSHSGRSLSIAIEPHLLLGA